MRLLIAVISVAILSTVSWANTTTPLCLIKAWQGSRPVGSASSGSATLVAKTQSQAFWISAYHVVRGARGIITLHRPDKKALVAKQVSQRTSADLVLLRSSSHTVDEDPLPVWKWRLEGRRYWAEGYASGTLKDFGRRSGTFTSAHGSKAEWSLPSIPGESGGCIYTLAVGRKYLAGVTSGSDWPRNPRGERNGYTFGGHSPQIVAFLTNSGLPVGPDGYVGSLTWAGRNWSDPTPNRGILRRLLPNCPQCDPQQQSDPHGLGDQYVPEDFVPPRDYTPPQQQQPQQQLPQPQPQQVPPHQHPQILDAPPQQITIPFPQQQQLQPAPEPQVIRQQLQLDIQGSPGRVDYDRIADLVRDEVDRQRPRDGRDGKDGRTPSRQELVELIGDAVAESGMPRGVTEQRVREIVAETPRGVSQSEVEQIVDGRMEPFAQSILQNILAIETPIRLDRGDGSVEELGTFRLGPSGFTIPWTDGRPSQIGRAAVATMVVVGTRDQRLEREVTAARRSFDRITLVPQDEVPPSVVVRRYPTLVAYASDGTVAGLWDGSRDVSTKLQAIARGMYP